MAKKTKDNRKDDDLLVVIEEMKKQGLSTDQIRKELNIGQGRLYKLLAKLQSKSVNPSGDIQIPPPTEQAIINETVNKASQEVVEKLSSKFAKDYVGSMEAASVLKELETRYRLTVESWGFTWEDFVQQAIEHAFNSYSEFVKIQYLLGILEKGVK